MAAHSGTSPPGCVPPLRGNTPMHSRSYAPALAALLVAGPAPAMSDPVNKQDLVGAWRYETSYIEFPDGHRESQFGEHPQGVLSFCPTAGIHILSCATICPGTVPV